MRRRSATWCLVLIVAAMSAAAQDLGTEAQRAEGKAHYDKYCAQCHGDNGDGKGYATPRVKPVPRDFTSGKYKFRTTPSGMLPTDEDIKRVIRVGLPYTSMPGWPNFSERDLQNITHYLKTFSEDFQNPERYAEPLQIPEPPEITDESIERGRGIFAQQGCPACHGELGRSDGMSAPTLVDDWGNNLRAVNMTQRWTFRGGPTRKDIFRTFSTGLNGTPMPSYVDSVQEQERWDLVNYIYSLGDGDEPGYASLLVVKSLDDALDLTNADELFAKAPVARFPLVGQIVEPGRNFDPSTTSIEVQAVYSRSEIAFRLRWDDMRAETAGSNSPMRETVLWDAEHAPADSGEESDEEGGFWGEAAEEEDAAGDDFWGDDEGAEQTAAVGAGFSDAVAIQFPTRLPTGNAKPYFLFGDVQRPVDLWFVDLADGLSRSYVARGTDNIEAFEGDEIETVSGYDRGRWTVLFKRSLESGSGISFEEEQYVPLAFSVWDGFNNERGNKRALSSWFYLYVEPREIVSPAGPMIRAGLITLLVELIVVFYVRRRFAAHRAPARVAVPEGA